MNRSSDIMTEGSIAGKMVRFAVPLFIGNLFQQLYNTADALIVGNLLGNSALASITGTSSLVYLLISFFGGLSAGAGVVISRYCGSRETDKMRSAVHTNLAVSLVFGVLLTVVGTTFTPTMLRWMDTPEDAMERACMYVRIYFAGSLGLVMYNSCRGIMQAVGDSRHPLEYLILSSIINVILDFLFIGVFRMDVDGAALATVLSQLISVALCMNRLIRTGEDYRVRLRELGFNREMLRLTLTYGIPSGLQNSVIGIANVVVPSNINAFGTMAMAGCGAYSKIEGFAFLPITSFTIALTTFVGQNLGAREYDRAKKGARFGLICSLLLAELIGGVIYIAAPLLIRMFTDEPEAVAFGVEKSRICALFYFLLAASHGLSAILRGAGKAVVPMVAMLSFWCVVRVLFLQIMVPIFRTIAVVNWVYPLTWLLSTIFLSAYYLRADWVHSFQREGEK